MGNPLPSVGILFSPNVRLYYYIAPIPHTKASLIALRAVLAVRRKTGNFKISFCQHLETVPFMPLLTARILARRLTNGSGWRFPVTVRGWWIAAVLAVDVKLRFQFYNLRLQLLIFIFQIGNDLVTLGHFGSGSSFKVVISFWSENTIFSIVLLSMINHTTFQIFIIYIDSFNKFLK